MIELSPETETLARKLAAAQPQSVDAVVHGSLEDRARVVGIETQSVRRRMSAERMLAVGRAIAAMPLLDPRSATEIMDDINT